MTTTQVKQVKKSPVLTPLSNNPVALDTIITVPPAPKPSQVNNLWRRIQMQFSLPTTDNNAINRQLDWYKKHPNYIQKMSKRAQPYLYFIVEEIEKRNMPLEIALLPIVESAFDPFAYSHGAASGMWQIIGDTGSRFGLASNWWYDGRRDIVASTGAALDYLQFLHKYFNGDWLHALAAYNSGEGRVRRAINKNKQQGKAIDFWSLTLPVETKDYVPKLLALATLLNDPLRYNIHWPVLSNNPQVVQVNTDSQIDLALAAQLAGMTLNQLYKLNPGFNQWATPPQGDHKILLPIDKASTFRDQLAKTPKNQRLKWTRYTIKSGDNLGSIAQNHHTTEAIIRQINQLNSHKIRAGDHLLIAIATNDLADYKLSIDARLAKVKNAKRGKLKTTHLVQSGDNLWDIARRYNVNHRSIAKWNGMAPSDNLRLGKKLVIWLDAKHTKSTAGNKVLRTIKYRVKPGDSIARIAQKFKLTMKDVITWNKLNKHKYLQPGQQLTLTIDVTKIDT